MRGRYRRLMVGVAVLVSFATSVAYGQARLQPVERLTIFDAGGRVVGNIVGFSDFGGGFPFFGPFTGDPAGPFNFAGKPPVFQPLVAFRVDSILLVLGVERRRFLGSENQLVFESADCSGTPFFDTEVSMVPRTAVRNHTVYVPDPNSGHRLITVRSFLFDLNADPFCEQLPEPFSQDGIPAQSVIDLSTQFTPPFTVR